MNKYRVYLDRESYTNGFIEIEAASSQEAFELVDDMNPYDLEDLAEWGSCGDSDVISLSGEVEYIHEPSVSDGLWK